MSNYYKYINKGSKIKEERLCDIFTFKSEDGLTFIVEVEHFEYNVLIVKFYLKAHKDSENKYNLTLEKIQKDKSRYSPKKSDITGSGRFLRILNTLLEISKEYYHKDNSVSFAFIGAPRIDEKESHLNSDNLTWSNTIRYRIYRTFALNNYSPDNFKHITIQESSFYLIKNKRNKELSTEKVLEIFKSYMLD